MKMLVLRGGGGVWGGLKFCVCECVRGLKKNR